MKQTLENFIKGFVGESQARNRYAMFASVARKEGYLQIADIFEQTAEQEKEHASWFYKMLQVAKKKEHYTKPEIEITGWAFCKIWTTLENLQYAAEGEHFEYSKLYPEFARIAKKEWFPEFAARILSIAVAERHHEERYKKLLKELKDKTLRKKSKPVERMCTKCGYIHKGKTPLDTCPSCGHDKTYAVVKCETY